MKKGGGHYGPHFHESVCRFHIINARITKTQDFVPLYTKHVPAKLFFEFSTSFENIEHCQKYPKGILLWKIKIVQKKLFLKNPLFFYLNMNSPCSLLPFEVHNSSVVLNFNFLAFFADIQISFIAWNCVIMLHRGLILVSIARKSSNCN